jgi:hypothetical protein
MMIHQSGLDVVDMSPFSSEPGSRLWQHAGISKERPTDSLVLELPADEPVDDRLDVDAFIRIWPELLNRWGADGTPTPEEHLHETDSTLVADWLTEMRMIRAEMPSELLSDSDGETEAPDPGA